MPNKMPEQRLELKTESTVPAGLNVKESYIRLPRVIARVVNVTVWLNLVCFETSPFI